MKIALITYYLRMNDYPTKYSLAALRLGEDLNSSGIDVELVPVALVDLDFAEFVKEKIEGKYDIVGISNYVWSRKATPQIAKIIRENAPKTSIIIGGPEVKYTDLSLYKNELFILGEREQSLLNAIRYIEQGRSDQSFFEKNPNIFDKEHPERKLIPERLLYKSPLFTKFRNIDRDFLYYETTRGCGYNCGYCGFKNRENVEFFDLEFVEEEIKRIGELGFKDVFIIDANLGGTPQRAKEILKMFAVYASQARLTIYLRPEFIDDEMICLLKATNIKEIRIGIQTTNKKIPEWIRSNSIEKVTKELPKLSKANIHWKAEFIVGLPGDDMKGLTESLEFAETVLRPTEICCYPLTVIKDTPMFKMVDSESKEWIKIDENSRAYESFSYTHDELIEMQEYAKRKMNNYLRQHSNWDRLTVQHKIENNKDIYKDVR